MCKHKADPKSETAKEAQRLEGLEQMNKIKTLYSKKGQQNTRSITSKYK